MDAPRRMRKGTGLKLSLGEPFMLYFGSIYPENVIQLVALKDFILNEIQRTPRETADYLVKMGLAREYKPRYVRQIDFDWVQFEDELKKKG